MKKNYYQILGLNPSATKQEIKNAYRLYATKLHPDKQSGDQFFEERFKEIKEAYDILIDDKKRLNYDKQFNHSESSYKWTRNYQYEEELRKREEDIKRKESEQVKEDIEQQKEKRLRKEKNLKSTIFYKDSTIEINGLSISFPNDTRLNIFDFDSVTYIKEKKERTKIGKLLFVAYWFIIIGIATIAFYIGIVLIIIGLILITVAVFKGSFRIFNDVISVGIYRIKLIGTYSQHDIIVRGNKRKVKKIVHAISSSIQNYYAT